MAGIDKKKAVATVFHCATALLTLLLLPAGTVASAQTATAVNVPTWRYDNTHSGANLKETLLTPANVNGTTFGKLFSRAVDGYVYAQPLYVSGLTMGDGLLHNVLFVATQHDTVYAFDADSNGGANAFPLWQASMLSTAHGAAAGTTTLPNSDIGSQDVVPEIGICSTPVIDVANQTIYLVAKTKENGTYIQRLHALNILTGAERTNSPSAPITATVTGGGNGSAGGKLTFSPEWQMNRVALDLFNGYVYVAFGSHGDNGPWHGWLMSFNAQTLAQKSAISLSPNGFGNGVWGAGAGLPIDTVSTGGRLFLSTGNGSFTTYPPLSSAVDYGDSLVRFDLTGGKLTPSDAMTPYNQQNLSDADADQGSGGVLMVPDQAGSHPHELIQIGKEGRILVVDRDTMGSYAPGGGSNTNILQDITGQIGGLWSTPAYWNGHVFFWGNGDRLKRFDMTNGVLSTTPSSIANASSNFPGASAVISSNGTTNGIVWAVRSDAYNANGSEVLYAFDPANLTTPLFESDSNPGRDDAGPATKFVVPVITNGKVYTGAAYQINVFGLLNGQAQAAAPVITPNGGSLAAPKSVTITTSTPGAVIYYTTDGSLPTVSAPVYSAPLTVATGTTVRAIASAANYLQSPVSTAVFTFVTQAPPPTMTPAPGSYASPQLVTLSDSLAGTTIYYTTDGSTPTKQSAVYSAPITISNTATLNAIAFSPTLTPSVMVSGAYTIQVGGTGINFGAGFSQVNGLTLNGSALHSDDSRLQLTDGGANEAGSVFANTPLNVSSFTNDFSFQLSNAQADGFTFTLQSNGPTALGPTGGGLGYGPDAPGGGGGIANSIAIKFDLYSNQGEGGDSTGLYQNGASPTLPSIDLTSSGIDLHSGDAMSVHMTYDGTTLAMTITDPVANKKFTQSFPINIAQVIGGTTAYAGFTGGSGGLSASQKLLSWTFLSNAAPVTLPPAISPNGGTFLVPQAVTLSDATPNAVIYYTVDGTTPTVNSAVYNSPLTISSGVVTLKAIAAGPGASASAVNAATFTIVPPTASSPVFTPAAGTYIGAQSVTLTDATNGASIYYTVDGSVPTINSTLYSGAITVAANATIQAIAAAPNYANSLAASAVYSIQSSGQTINYGSGFSDASGISFNGNAQLDTTTSALEVTDGNGDEAGSAWSTTPIDVSAFTSDFTFKMANAAADGFTFTVQSAGTGALGSAGGGLGYGAFNGGPGIANSVALKFDIYDNNGEGANSIGVYTNGAAPTLPATDLTGSGILLSSGDTFHIHLVYNGSALGVTITDTNTSASYSASYPVDIAGALGTTAGYAGFTGGTGGLTVATEILSWTFTAVKSSATSEPIFAPAPGTYPNPVAVSLTDLTANSTIYYTVDGSQPSHASATYGSPIQVSGNSLTIKAFASAAGLDDSPVVIGSYLIQQPLVAQVTLSPAPGIYNSAQSVLLTTPTSGAVIHYTLDGSTPNAASPVYGGALAVNLSETVRAVAVVSGGVSNTTGGAYVIQSGGAAINFAGGFAGAKGLTLNGNALNPNDGTLELTDGGTNEVSSVFFNTPVDARQFQTSFQFQLTNAVADGFTFTLQANTATAIGPFGGGLGYGPDTPGGAGGIPNSIAVKFDLYANQTEGTDSTGLYTNGASPTIPAIDLTPSGVVLTSGDKMQANLVYDGTNLALTITDLATQAVFKQSFPINIPATLNSATAYAGFTAGDGGSTAIQRILNWVYTPSAQNAVAPTFTPTAGIYSSAQAIKMVDTTPGAAIYYTVDGSMPSTQSALYTGALSVSSGTVTVNAIAVAPGYGASAVATASYTIQNLAATPVFSPAPGTYASALSPTLADATPGAVIHYTTDGSTPTAASPVYSAAIPINSGSVTLSALAVAAGYGNSPVVVGKYTISTSTPQASVLVGDQTLETAKDSNAAGMAEAYPFTATASGSLSSLSFYLDSASTGTQATVGLYADNKGTPGALLTAATLKTPAAGKWNTVAVKATPVTSGTAYWIAILNPASGTLSFRDRSSGSCKSQTNAAKSLTALPTTWTKGTSYSACPISAYGSQAVTQTASLQLSTNQLTLTATQGGASPAAATVAVTNAGAGTLTYSASSDSAWLTVTPASGTAPQTLTLTPSTSNLAAGSYTAHVVVTATGASNAPQVITAGLTVSKPATSGLLLGDQSVEAGNDSNSSGKAEAFPATAVASGPTASLSIYIDASSAATKVMVGVYSSNGSHPGALLGQVSLASPAAGWNKLPLTGINLSAGTQYWLAVLGTGGTVHFRDKATGSCSSETNSKSGLTTLPQTWTTGSQYPECVLSSYIVSQ